MGSASCIREAICLGIIVTRVHGSLLVGTDPALAKNSSVFVEGPQEPAISFIMPPEAYSIDSVTLSLRDYESASDHPAIGFYTDNGGRPGIRVGSPLRNPYSASDTSSDFTFFPSGSLTLNPGQTYWVLVSSSGGSFSWNSCDAPAATPTGAASFSSYKVGLNYGADYVEDHPVPSFTIHATAVPEPPVSALILTGSLLFLARRTRRS